MHETVEASCRRWSNGIEYECRSMWVATTTMNTLASPLETLRRQGLDLRKSDLDGLKR